MGLTASSRPFRFATRPHHQSMKSLPANPTNVPPADKCERPFTVLTHHKPHELSEIIEVSTSSKATLARRYSISCMDGATDAIELEGGSTGPSGPDVKDANKSPTVAKNADSTLTQPASPRCETQSIAPSAASLPLEDIPQRKSSISALSRVYHDSRRTSLQDLPAELKSRHHPALSRGRTNSPVKLSLAKGAQSSDALRASPLRTFIRTPTPFYLLDKDSAHNARLDMTVRLPSPLFVSGGTVEGQIELKIDKSANKKLRSRPLLISRLSVDVIGVEEVEDGRRQIFLSLATELFSSQHPPPSTIVVSQTPEKGPELYWQTKPATATIPFCVNLPLKLGPPPYSSRQASIRYLLCPSAVIKIGEKRSAVRQAWTIQMLTVYDPEKALASLPSPLLASDTLTLAYRPVIQSVKVTAGLHRQTWVSGSAIFTDVHIVNNSDKILKRIELHLEKSMLWFSHSAASTAEKRANKLRLPDKIETETVYKSIIKKNKQWEGVAKQASELRTCEIEIPKGHVTVGHGRFFEVRYFVKVTIVVAKSKVVSVQLPVTVIHINSLDIMPNSVAQVAASIEVKRSMAIAAIGKSIAQLPHTQGQAFSAARRQSFNGGKHLADNINFDDVISLKYDLDNSPRRLRDLNEAISNKVSAVESRPSNENEQPGTTACYRHLTLRPSCYHCHLLYTEHATKHHLDDGPKLPRLQVSTSGLGFSESEFEIPQDSPPRKVMLSEQERRMINQQRELRLQRQMGQQNPQTSYFEKSPDRPGSNSAGFKNVAAMLNADTDKTATSGSLSFSATARSGQPRNASIHMKRSSLPPSTVGRRNRSRTTPDHMRGFSDGDSGTRRTSRPTRGVRSMDREDKYPFSGYNLAENDVFGPGKPLTDRRERMGRRRSVQAR